MKILITGASGFIGKSLIDKLTNKSFDIIALSRKKKVNQTNIKFIQDDIKLNKKIDLVKNFKPEVIIHLSWEGIPNFNKIKIKKNLKDQKIFFKKILKFQSLKKLIVTGTCLEYGKINGKCSENTSLTKNHNLGLAKIKLFNFVQNKKNQKIKFYWLRLFYVYGENQRKKSLIPLLISSIKRRKSLYLKNIYNAHDYIHIDDVCDVIKKIVSHNVKPGVYNVGYGKAINILKIIEILEKLSRNKILFRSLEKSQKYSFYSCNNKLNKNINFNPKITLKKGLYNLIKRYER